MEKRLNELPKRVVVQKQSAANSSNSSSISDIASVTDTEKTITSLEHQVEEQKLLRIQDARQVETKAAKIKEWVTNKLKELEEQNQVLREQNVKCNQQLDLLRWVNGFSNEWVGGIKRWQLQFSDSQVLNWFIFVWRIFEREKFNSR